MNNTIPEWIAGLSDEDFQFIKRLLLASGSLKELAQQYGITYPTLRLRLNRLIEKVKILDSEKPKTNFHKTVRQMVADGKLNITTAKKLINEFEKEMK
jgi:hypothetical protein